MLAASCSHGKSNYAIIFATVLIVFPIVLLSGLTEPFQQSKTWVRITNKHFGAASLADSDSGRTLVLYQITSEGEWQNIVRDQVTKLIFSGLYAELSLVHCTVFGASPNASSDAQTYLSGYGSKFRVVGMPGPPTVSQSIASLSTDLTASDRVLFLSTYGAGPEDSETGKAAFHWRTLMEYKLIKGYRECLQMLRQRDIVGWFRPPN